MDFKTLWTSLISTAAITAFFWWFLRVWVKHRLTKGFEKFKIETQSELERKKVIMQGEIKSKVEAELGEKAAQREYELQARKRLYSTIGPLKFQLLLACRDLALHIDNFYPYSLSPQDYYGKSTLYRIIRPLAIAELIERQLSIVDFTIDKEAINLLRFKKNSFYSFSESKPILDHPNEDWDTTREHLYHHLVYKLASSFIKYSMNEEGRIYFFHEFEDDLQFDQELNNTLKPLVEILHDFTINSKPVFWIRIVFYGYVCSTLVNTMGKEIGFDQIDFNTKALLQKSQDKFTNDNIEKLLKMFKEINLQGL